MILEKDKEDRTKYYLDIKWANRNVNVVEWAKIPKFSALDSSQTSRIIYCDVLVDMIFGHIKLYSREIRHGSDFSTVQLIFLSILLLTGYHKLPDHKMY